MKRFLVSLFFLALIVAGLAGGPLYGDAPYLLYSTYLGGYSDDAGYGITVHESCAYVTGYTSSPNFPTASYQPFNAGGEDVFFARLSQPGDTLIFASYLGGYGNERGQGIKVDSVGAIYLTGFTNSTNFPVEDPYQGYLAGEYDAFFARFSTPTGLEYSTYLGGYGDDRGTGIDLINTAGYGCAYITGFTASTNFPVLNPYQANLAGAYDAFVSEFTAETIVTDLIYSTYLGGYSTDKGYGISLDTAGAPCITGMTTSNDFPTENPYQPTRAANEDAFVCKFASSGTDLEYSTYLGGEGADGGYGVIEGSSYVTGYTSSSDFPTLNPYQANLAGVYDAFVTKFTDSGSDLVYSTYLGGSNNDYGRGISLGNDSCAFVTGYTKSNDFPTVDPYQASLNTDYDAFFTRLTVSGSALEYSTYFGGDEDDRGYGICVEPLDGTYYSVYGVGMTASSDFPTKNPYQPSLAGDDDAFVCKLTYQGYHPTSTPTPPTPTPTPTPEGYKSPTPTPTPSPSPEPVWQQMPNMTDGFDNPSTWSSSTYIVIADDWRCNDTDPIGRVRWWGSYLGWMEDTDALVPPPFSPYYFLLSWHEYTHPAGGWSYPAGLLAEEKAYFCSETWYGAVPDWQTGTAWEHEYLYDRILTTSWAQESGYYYFINIQAVFSTDSYYYWGWKNCETTWNDDAVWSSDGTAWNRLTWPTGHRLDGQSMDMSFELSKVNTRTPTPTTTPTPEGYQTPTPTPAGYKTPIPTPTIPLIDQGFDRFNIGTRPTGWTFTNCNENSDTYTTAANSGRTLPSLKLDALGDKVFTKTFSDPDSLYFWVKGQGVDAASALLVEEFHSSSWNNLVHIDNLPTTGTTEGPFALNGSTTQLQFIYNKSAGNLAFDDVRVTKNTPTPTPTPVGYKTPTPSVTPTVTPTPTPPWTCCIWYWRYLEPSTDPIIGLATISNHIFALTTNDLYIYSTSTWNVLTKLTEPDGATGGVYDDGEYLFAASGNKLYRWDNEHTSISLAESTDLGKTINSIYGDDSYYLYAAYADGNVERFDRADFTSSTVLSNSGSNRYDVFVDSYYVYAADGDKQIYVWNESNLNFITAFSPQSASNWATESAAMTAVHADSYYLFAGAGNPNVYEFELGTFNYKTRKDFATETITALFADPLDRHYYASSEDDNIYVYETDWWNAHTILTEGPDDMNDVCATTDFLIGGCSDGKIYIWLTENTPTPIPSPTALLITPTPTAAPNHKIVINEVAWMGTSHSTSDEWIELYNPTTGDINIENWSIYGADTGACINFASYDGFTTFTVAAEGYATFANDSWVFQSGAVETIWDDTISLSNTGDRIILYDQPDCSIGTGDVIDIVDDDDGSWFAGTSNPKTMERRDPGRYGTDPANWVTWSGVAFATDSGGWDIHGSPGTFNTGSSVETPTPTPVPPTPTPTPTPMGYNTPPPTPTPDGYKTPIPTLTPAVYGNVVFNELAWMGTKYGGYNDEWIELYVNKGGEFDMINWTIEAADGTPSFTILSNIEVNPGDYVLLERQDDNTVSDIAAYFVYPYATWLENGGEELWLKDASGEVVDHIDMANYWWAGDNSTYYTMERVQPEWPSDKHYNWADWSPPTQSGKDATGQDLTATAKALNSAWNASTALPAPTSTPPNYRDICFNEIAWMGTEAASAHEWIECWNSTTGTIDMKGFRIYTMSGNVDFTVLSTVNITADGYYIFEMATDYVVRDVTGYIYSSGYLSNAGERLILESNGVIWDDIDFADAWPAGVNDPVVYTMEKINRAANGNDPTNWTNNDGVTVNGRDADDVPINGTAKADNSVCIGCRRAPRGPAGGIFQPDLYPKDLYYPAPAPAEELPAPPPAPEEPDLVRVESADYDGDGIADVAVFRPTTGLWVIRDLSRFYFGESDDLPVSGDYDGDGSTDVAVYRSGLWAIKDLGRAYLGTGDDVPVPGDYDGDGQSDLAVFRPASGLWVAPGIIRAYFGGADDIPIPGDYDGDGTVDLAVFRPEKGCWTIRGISRFYLGAAGDIPVPADYTAGGADTAAIYRPVGGLWVVRGLSRVYFGGEGDIPLPGDYTGDGAADIATFRPGTGLLTR